MHSSLTAAKWHCRSARDAIIQRLDSPPLSALSSLLLSSAASTPTLSRCVKERLSRSPHDDIWPPKRSLFWKLSTERRSSSRYHSWQRRLSWFSIMLRAC